MQYPLVKPRYYYSLLKEIVEFVKQPSNIEDIGKSTKRKVYDTIGLFVLKILFLIPISLLIGLIHDPDNTAKISLAERFTPLMLLLVTVIILPLIEEVCFRLSLKFKPVYLASSLGVLCYYILTKVVYSTKVTAIDDSFIYRFLFSIGVFVLSFFLLNINLIKEKAIRFWNHNFRFIYYASCLVFAFIHIFNYELSWINLALLPIITLPQLMSGIIAGYTRTVFGFEYPVIFHMTTNLIAVSLSLLPFADFCM